MPGFMKELYSFKDQLDKADDAAKKEVEEVNIASRTVEK